MYVRPRKLSKRTFYEAVCIALVILCFLFPYTGDDWAWGSGIGLTRLAKHFEAYNGRYVGNLIVLILTRFPLLKAVTMAVCIGGIVWLLYKSTGKQVVGMLLAACSLLFMPVSMLRQAIVWTSGFANYTISIFLTLLYILYIQQIYSDKAPTYSSAAALPMLLLGAANALIVEHMTIYNVVLSLYVLIFTGVAFKKVYLPHVAYAIGTIGGSVLMFSNTAYGFISAGKDAYRTMAVDSGLIQRLQNNMSVILREMFLNNLLLTVLLSVAIGVLWWGVRRTIQPGIRRLGDGAIAVVTVFTIWVAVYMIFGTKMPSLWGSVGEIATVIYLLAIGMLLVIVPCTRLQRVKLLFAFGSAVMMMAPLLVVTPIGSRCFLAPYVMMVYLALELYGLWTVRQRQVAARGVKPLAAAVAVGFLYLLCVYGTIAVADHQRVERARTQIAAGAETIQVKELPFKQYVWCSSPKHGSVWETRFKLFYGLDSHVRIYTK